MVVVLRNTGDVNSIGVRYQTLAGRKSDDLRLVYEWFIVDRPADKDMWYYLVIKSGSVFGDAGLAKILEEATKKLYARAWLDCVDLDSKKFEDETKNKNKFLIPSFADVLKEYQMTAYRTHSTFSPLYKELSKQKVS